MLRLLSAALMAGLLFSAGPARADTAEWESSYDPGKQLRRSDFAMGLLLGGAVGDVSGYPNEILKIDDPRYRASTGVGGGPAGGVWIGGALRDWIVVGVGVDTASVSGNGYKSGASYFVFHLEGYPLFPQGGVFQDLGLLAEFGVGSRSIKAGSESAADGGLMSIASIGVVYEPLRLGSHLNFGPQIQYTFQGSQSLTANFATIGLRASFYGGPG
jgi:hypothetical protein